jgi:hypothetical protein
MYYTRPVGLRRITSVLLPAAALLVVAPLAARQLPPDLASVVSLTAGHRLMREKVSIGAGAIDVTFAIPSDAEDEEIASLVAETRTALARLDAWLGPLPAPAINVILLPWHGGLAGASYPGVVVTGTRWLSTSRDPVFARRLLAALARQYTFSFAAPGDAHASFEEGLALYLGRRLIHEQLHSRNFETPRFFGGFVPFSLRSVLNSRKPEDRRAQVTHVADVEMPADAPWRAASAAPGAPAHHIAVVLQTLERHLGWPAFQQVLQQFMDRFRGRTATPADFAAVATEVIGIDLSRFFEPGILAGDSFDYALVEVRNEVTDGGFTSRVTVRRTGAEPPVNDVPVLVRFDDGAEVTELLAARDVEQTFVYRARARAVLASIDPNALLLIDADRENNTRNVQPATDWIGVRIALNWMMWLQNVMLTHTSLL